MMRQQATVDGIPMSWIERGQGRPVVLIHGIPTSPELWRHVLPRLVEVRALAWEMVGYGRSIPEGRERNISVAMQAEYLAKWMRHLRIGRAVLAGHDLGGGVAQILAVRHTELCAGLFLTNAIGYDSWPIPSVRLMQAWAPVMKRLPRPLLKLVLKMLFHRGHASRTQAQEAYGVHAPNYLAADGAAALIRQMQQLKTSDTLAVAHALPKLGIPARIAWGEDDQFQKIVYGERFARDLGAPLTRIKGGKHLTPEDYPAIIADAIMKLAGAAPA